MSLCSGSCRLNPRSLSRSNRLLTISAVGWLCREQGTSGKRRRRLAIAWGSS
ncbi:hypothetical protein D3C71_2127090 [compost metagenome]